MEWVFLLIGFFIARHFGWGAATIFYAVMATAYRLMILFSNSNDGGDETGYDGDNGWQSVETKKASFDDYRTLGVEESASVEEVKSAYRRRARECHPDVCHDADAASRFRAVNEAYNSIMKTKGLL